MKEMVAVFWNADGVLLVNFLEQGCTINDGGSLLTNKNLLPKSEGDGGGVWNAAPI